MTEYGITRSDPGRAASAVTRLGAVLACGLLLSACESQNAGAEGDVPDIVQGGSNDLELLAHAIHRTYYRQDGSGTIWSVSSP